MEDSRQDLRTEFRAATESSGLAGFGLASAVEGGWRIEDGGMKMEESEKRMEDEGWRKEDGGGGRKTEVGGWRIHVRT